MNALQKLEEKLSLTGIEDMTPIELVILAGDTDIVDDETRIKAAEQLAAQAATIANYETARQEDATRIDALIAERDRLREVAATAEGFRIYVNNPSAWEYYDDVMSERLRLLVQLAARALEEVTG